MAQSVKSRQLGSEVQSGGKSQGISYFLVSGLFFQEKG